MKVLFPIYPKRPLELTEAEITGPWEFTPEYPTEIDLYRAVFVNPVNGARMALPVHRLEITLLPVWPDQS